MKRTSLCLLIASGMLCSSCAAAMPIVKSVTQIATDLCIQQENESRSPGDTNIDAFCHDEKILADIEHALFGIKHSFAMKHHAMPEAEADAGTAPIPANPF